MLVLTRKIGEGIVIGPDGDIEITVLSVTGKQVRLGIVAPQDQRIDRTEVRDRMSLVPAGLPCPELELSEIDMRLQTLAR